MVDPFSAWSQMMAAGLDVQSTWFRSLETVQASGTVIEARGKKMRQAASSPLHADVAELGRMLPEKVDAFSRSASAITRDAMAMQAAWSAHMQRVGLMMLAGRVPTMTEASRLANQTTEYALGAVTAGAKLGRNALTPIHRAAIGNAKRLKRAKP